MNLTSTRRITAALASTVGALLLSSLGGPAASADPYADLPADPGTLGEVLPGSFVTATFNVLGNSHTAGSDPRPSGAARMVPAVQLLQDNGVDVVGFQELENPQRDAFTKLAGSTYQLYYPGKDPRDSIAFRKDRFELVGSDTSIRIPYRRNVRTMPVVILKDKVTGQKTIFLSVHNVAGAGAKWVERRLTSLRREFRGITRLREATGLPVVFLGDFNDRREIFYCKVLSKSLFSSSVWWLAEKTCSLPRRAGIDWIFGTPEVTFTGYEKQDGGLVDAATDHPLVLARVLR
jgi:endonuclease/exonuclease/phosphatase family metal-dependent hydrolase